MHSYVDAINPTPFFLAPPACAGLGVRMTPPTDAALAVAETTAPHWALPGALALRLVVLAALAIALSGAVSGWLVARASGQEAVQRMEDQQTDEVEVFARLLASKIEQSQKVLRNVAEGITPEMLELPASLEWLLQQSLPAVQFFDSMLVARQDGELRVNLQNGRFEKTANLEPSARDALRRTLVDGKPMVAELMASRSSEARIMFTMPLHRDDGTVLGVVAGMLRLQSQGLLPISMAVPQRADTRLVVFTREGTILSHSDPARVMGQVHDEPGLAPVFARWLEHDSPVMGAASTEMVPGHIVSMAGMPLPQWMVARVSDTQALLAPLQGAQRKAWWLAAAAIALTVALFALLAFWMFQPLAQLRDRAGQLLDGSADVPGAMPWPRAGGEVGALVEVFEGVQNQQDDAQQRHRVLERQYQAILDVSSVGIAITRGDRLVSMSRQACQMLGFVPVELQGQPLACIYPAERDSFGLDRRIEDSFAVHGGFGGDVCLRRKDGSPVWARVQGRAVDLQAPDGDRVWMVEEMTAAHEERRQDSWVTTHDPLTQLENRQGFEQRLRLLLAADQPPIDSRPTPLNGVEGLSVSGVVLFLDLDHFTVVNDVAGHDAGDDVLRHVARLLEVQVRQSGWAARLGGDEFAVVLPGCSSAHGLAVAEQLRAAVQGWEPVYQGRSFTLGVSIGMVPLEPGLQDVAAVLHAADMACYDAKRAGRNQVVQRMVQGSMLAAG